MFNISISIYTSKGILRLYQAKRCNDNEEIKSFIKSLMPDYYTKEWNVEVFNCPNGWLRMAHNTKEERSLVNCIKIK